MKKDGGGKSSVYKHFTSVLLKENKGVDNARFEGLNRITGEYVMFVDSDDYLPPGAIKTLVNELERTDADIVQGCFRRVLGDNGFIKKDLSSRYMEIEQPELFDDYFITFFGKPLLMVNLCGKIHKRELFLESQIKPSGYRFGEDAIMSMKIFPFVKKYVVIPDIVYCYRYGGMTSKFKPYLYTELKKQYYEALQILHDYKYEKGIAQLHYSMAKNFIGIIGIMFNSKIKYSDVLDFYRNELETGELKQFVLERPDCKDSYYRRLYNSVKSGVIDEMWLRDLKVVNRPKLKEKIIRRLYTGLGKYL